METYLESWLEKPSLLNQNVRCEKDSKRSMSSENRVCSHSPSAMTAPQHGVALQHCPGNRAGAVPQRTGANTGTSTCRQTHLSKPRGFNTALTLGCQEPRKVKTGHKARGENYKAKAEQGVEVEAREHRSCRKLLEALHFN